MDDETSTADFSVLENLFGFHLRLAQVHLFAHFRDELRDFAMTPGQAGILLLIRDNAGISQSALARAVGVERATLGQTVEGLVRRGLVERRPKPDDRRAWALHLTGEGETFAARLLPAIEAHEAELLRAFTPEEAVRLRDLLRKFVRRGRSKP